MGNGGKVVEQQRARELRAQSWTLDEIATELGVSKSSASLWTRGVDFEPRPRNRGHASHRPHPLTIKKEAELERCRVEAIERVGSLSDRDLEMFALALYAGEGAKADGSGVIFANNDARLVVTFLTWLRAAFDVDESRLRMRLYLHEDLDLAAALRYWSGVTSIPVGQFSKPYRAVADATRRTNRHVYGCGTVIYHCTPTHRSVMARVDAISSRFDNPG